MHNNNYTHTQWKNIMYGPKNLTFMKYLLCQECNTGLSGV